MENVTMEEAKMSEDISADTNISQLDYVRCFWWYDRIITLVMSVRGHFGTFCLHYYYTGFLKGLKMPCLFY